MGLHCCEGFSLASASGSCLLVAVSGFLIVVAFLVAEHRLQGFSNCCTWAQSLWIPGSTAEAQKMWHMGLVAPRYVGSSWIWDQTHVSYIGR